MPSNTKLGWRDEFSNRSTHSSFFHFPIRYLLRWAPRAQCNKYFFASNDIGSSCTPDSIHRSEPQFHCLASGAGDSPYYCSSNCRPKGRPFLANVRRLFSNRCVDCYDATSDRHRVTTACVGHSQPSTHLVSNSTHTLRDSISAPGTENSARALSTILGPLTNHLPPDTPKNLLREFGSLSGIAGASEAQLRRFLGERHPLVDTLLVCRHLFDAALREQAERAPLDPSDINLRRYLVSQLGFRRHERLVAIFGNGQGKFITMKTIAQGVLDKVDVSSRTIFGHAIALDARSLLLAHNHPSGCANPSDSDVLATREIKQLAEALGIELLDHLIVAGGQVVSMRDRGLM